MVRIDALDCASVHSLASNVDVFDCAAVHSFARNVLIRQSGCRMRVL